VITLRVVKFCPFGGMSREFRPRTVVGPGGPTDVLRLTNPVKLFRLVTVTCEVPDVPRIRDSVDGFALVEKLGTPGRLLKLAVWGVSGTAVAEPLNIVIQSPPVTLVLEHPV
jgi:hypothetical protein